MKRLLLASLLAFPALSFAEIVTVTAHRASAYDAPREDAKAVLPLKKGQRLKTEGEARDGFYRLRTKSGKVVWISHDDVKAEAPAKPAAPAKQEGEGSSAETPEESFKRWTIDFGAASNFSSGSSAYEISVGVNYAIYRWLVFRNAPFYRSQSSGPSVFGLDSSLQGRYGWGLGGGFQVFGMLGAGYRIANQGASAPIAEAGFGVRKDAFQVNLSIKEVFHSFVTSGADNETLFSVGVSGGMSF